MFVKWAGHRCRLIGAVEGDNIVIDTSLAVGKELLPGAPWEFFQRVLASV